MTAEEILEKIRSHPRLVIVDDFELVVEKGSRARRTYVLGETKESELEDYTWISLRLLHRRQPGRAVVAVESPDSIPLLIENAFASSRLTSPDPWFRFPLWRSQTPENFSAERSPIPTSCYRPDLGFELEEQYHQLFSERWIFRRTERKQLHAKNFATSGRLVAGAGENALACDLSRNVVASSVLPELRARWEEQGEGRRCPAKSWPRQLLFRPEAMAMILPEWAAEFCGDKVLEGSGVLGVPGEQAIFSKKLNIVDNGALPEGQNTWPFDLEGSPTQETILVEEGRFRGILLDCHAAARDNRLSTGNLIKADPLEWPQVGPSNFYVQRGVASPADLLGSVNDGVLVERITRDRQGRKWGEGWRVAQGKLAEPVYGIPLPADLRTVLKQVIEVGNDLTFFGGWGSPSILCQDLPLSNA